MIRIILLSLFLFITSVHAQLLDEKIKNIIGEQKYLLHKGLIGHLFKNKEAYISSDRVKYFNLFKTLQENGLLDTRLQKRGEISLQFKVFNNMKKGYKILNDTLETLGYKYFFTTSFENNMKYLLWNISFQAEYSVDPVVFIKELKENGAQVLNVIKLNERDWSYDIDFASASLEKSTTIDTNEKVNFRKLLKPLLLNANGVQSLEISSHSLNRWYPKIIFYDQNLDVLKTVEYNTFQKRVKLEAPLGTQYIRVTDLYNLINIKRGLTIIVR